MRDPVGDRLDQPAGLLHDRRADLVDRLIIDRLREVVVQRGLFDIGFDLHVDDKAVAPLLLVHIVAVMGEEGHAFEGDCGHKLFSLLKQCYR